MANTNKHSSLLQHNICKLKARIISNIGSHLAIKQMCNLVNMTVNVSYFNSSLTLVCKTYIDLGTLNLVELSAEVDYASRSSTVTEQLTQSSKGEGLGITNVAGT